MATEVIIIGENAKKKALKPITFEYYVSVGSGATPTATEPKEFKCIELIARKYSSGSEVLDLMFAYNENRDCGMLYLGQFNDGIVEE